MKLQTLILLFLTCTSASAEFQLLPKARHQLFDTFSNFTGVQSGLIYRTGGRSWGSLGVYVPLFQFNTFEKNTQFVLYSSVHSGFKLQPQGLGVYTQTTDARVGFGFNFELTSKSRLTLGWQHQSGHISDNVPDAGLIGPNLGNEILFARFIHDVGEYFRLGVTFKPFYSSEPKMKILAADQFVEYMPFGASQDPRKATPYLALNIDEQGNDFRYMVGTNFQMGVYYGSHFQEDYTPNIRLMIGFYHGPDPRLKYFQYYDRTSDFGYAGFMIGI